MQLCKPCLNKWELLAVLVLPHLPSIRDEVNEDDGYWLPTCTSNMTALNLMATALSSIYLTNASISRVLSVYNTIWYVTRLAQAPTCLCSPPNMTSFPHLLPFFLFFLFPCLPTFPPQLSPFILSIYSLLQTTVLPPDSAGLWASLWHHLVPGGGKGVDSGGVQSYFVGGSFVSMTPWAVHQSR